MKKFVLATFLAFIFGATAFIAAPETADARWRRRKCNRLASRVQRWRSVHERYLRRWRRCKRVLHWTHPRCRSLRRTVRAWYRNVRRARRNYRRWECHFAWRNWGNDPWAGGDNGGHAGNNHAAQCNALRSRVVRWRSIRNRYRRRWRRCKRVLGWTHPRCRRLRRRVRGWYARVRAARSNYSRWGCRFAWRAWNSPWAQQPPHDGGHAGGNHAAQCASLRSRVVRWRSIRRSYRRRWRRCKRGLGWSHPRCRRLRRRVRRWRRRVRRARRRYRRWNCHFAWRSWNGGW